MQVTKDDFFKLVSNLDNIPFTQTEAWLEYAYGGLLDRVRYYVDDATSVHVAAWGLVSKRPFIGTKVLFDGICKSAECKSKYIREFLKQVKQDGYNMICVSDIDEYDPEYEIGIRQAGFVRPLGITLCPMTLVVDLQKPFNFHRNWRRNVQKALQNNCSFVVIEMPSEDDITAFANIFVEQKRRKGLKASPSAQSIKRLLKGDKYKMFAIEMGGTKISYRISYTNNNNTVYDVYASNSDEAISVGAAYLLQENILQYFKEKGFLSFDYGRISPSAGCMNNIYVAKSYSGGHPIGYNGEWEYCDKLWRSFFYSFYTFIRNHAERY